MPVVVLRTTDGGWHPLAPFRILAVMCHPYSRELRRRMLSLVEAETYVGPARRAKLDSNAFQDEVRRAKVRSMLVGDLLLYLIQLHAHERPATITRALKLVTAPYPRWQQPTGAAWRIEDQRAPRIRIHRAAVMDAFHDYLPVAHLWAAFVVNIVEEPERFWQATESTLPTLIGVAKGLEDLAATIPWRGRDRQYLFERRRAWRFAFPGSEADRITRIRESIAQHIPLLTPRQRAILAS